LFQAQIAAAPTEVTPDVAALLARQAVEDTPIGDSNGKLQVWVIHDLKPVEVPKEKHGQFYGGDSYVMLYTYTDKRGREEYIIYFWLGNTSSNDEKGTAALFAKELDDRYGGRPVQVRVVQGKEPPHLRQLFNGAMIIHTCGNSSGWNNTNDADSYDTDGVALFHVRGTNPSNTSAVQVPEVRIRNCSCDNMCANVSISIGCCIFEQRGRLRIDHTYSCTRVVRQWIEC
jgi:hypothetical protein